MNSSGALVFFGKKRQNSQYTIIHLSVYCLHLSWTVLTSFIILSRLDSTALGTEYEPYRYLLNERVSRWSNEWSNLKETESLLHSVGVARGTHSTWESSPPCEGLWGAAEVTTANTFVTLSFPWHIFPWDFLLHHWQVEQADNGSGFKGKGT